MESSNLTHIVLESVGPFSSGRYSCEVSADHPSFQTVIYSGEMSVIQLPSLPPRIDVLQPIYRPGDILMANCTIEDSSPVAYLEWRVNSVLVSYVLHWVLTFFFILLNEIGKYIIRYRILSAYKEFINWSRNNNTWNNFSSFSRTF